LSKVVKQKAQYRLQTTTNCNVHP